MSSRADYVGRPNTGPVRATVHEISIFTLLQGPGPVIPTFHNMSGQTGLSRPNTGPVNWIYNIQTIFNYLARAEQKPTQSNQLLAWPGKYRPSKTNGWENVKFNPFSKIGQIPDRLFTNVGTARDKPDKYRPSQTDFSQNLDFNPFEMPEQIPTQSYRNWGPFFSIYIKLTNL